MFRMIVGLALLAFALSMQANAGGVYAGATFGAGWDNESNLPFVTEDTGLHGAIQIGTHVDGVPGLRVELEGYFATHDASLFGVIPMAHDTQALMVNAAYDMAFFDLGRFVPYVMAGAGVAHTELTVGGLAPLTVENDGFAWQVGAGVNYNITDSVAVGVGYRHLEAPELELFGFEIDGGSNDVVEARLRLKL